MHKIIAINRENNDSWEISEKGNDFDDKDAEEEQKEIEIDIEFPLQQLRSQSSKVVCVRNSPLM